MVVSKLAHPNKVILNPKGGIPPDSKSGVSMAGILILMGILFIKVMAG